jgi:hypothetical protein
MGDRQRPFAGHRLPPVQVRLIDRVFVGASDDPDFDILGHILIDRYRRAVRYVSRFGSVQSVSCELFLLVGRLAEGLETLRRLPVVLVIAFVSRLT